MSPAFGVAVLALIEIGSGILIRSMATFVSIITLAVPYIYVCMPVWWCLMVLKGFWEFSC
jgi:hypothetical protein